MTRVGPAGAPSSTAEGNTENACTKDKAEGDREARAASSGRKMWRKRAAGIGAERRRRLLERRVDAGDVGQRQQEGERKAGDHERDRSTPQ